MTTTTSATTENEEATLRMNEARMAEAIEAELLAQVPRELRDGDGRFHIDSEAKARWAIAKLHEKSDTIERVKKESAEWLRVLTSDRERFAKRFVPELEAWANQQLEPGKKTVRTLAGKLTFRDAGLGVTCSDREAATEWARKNKPEWVKISYDLADLAAVKKALVPTPGPDGELNMPELPPGFTYEEPRRVFAVEGLKL